MDIQAPVSEARQVLLAALESLDEIQAEHGEAQRLYLTVAYAHSIEGQTCTGWNSTDDPTFVTAALLRTVADAIEQGRGGDDDEDS